MPPSGLTGAPQLVSREVWWLPSIASDECSFGTVSCLTLTLTVDSEVSAEAV